MRKGTYSTQDSAGNVQNMFIVIAHVITIVINIILITVISNYNTQLSQLGSKRDFWILVIYLS